MEINFLEVLKLFFFISVLFVENVIKIKRIGVFILSYMIRRRCLCVDFVDKYFKNLYFYSI